MISAAFTKSYDGRCVLSVPELTWKKGSITAVIGANGSGKTTLGKILSGIEASDQKRAVMPGVTVGYLPQKPYPFRMSLEKNIRLNGSDRKRQVQLMQSLKLTTLRQSSAVRLSGGETAKMALARLFMRSYDLVLLDEPTAAMDLESTAAAEALICDYAKETGSAVVIITHSLAQAGRIADELLFLCSGKVTESGAVQSLLQHPNTAELKQFLAFY